MRFQTWVRPVFVFLLALALLVVPPAPGAAGGT